jgi:hypothetical protein
MAKTTQTVTVAVCDRCKREGDTGDAGGINHKGNAWLCMDCADAFLSFLANKATKGQP